MRKRPIIGDIHFFRAFKNGPHYQMIINTLNRKNLAVENNEGIKRKVPNCYIDGEKDQSIQIA